MTGQRFSIDTNILVYSIDRDAGTRHEQSRDLVDALADRECVLTVQALAEFFHASAAPGSFVFKERQQAHSRAVCNCWRDAEDGRKDKHWTFLRAFAYFAQGGLPERVHEAVLRKSYAGEIVGHISRDSTAIEAREKPLKNPAY